MKSTIIYMATLTIWLISEVAYGQSPLAFNYQGVARNSAGEVYTSKQISLEISLHRDFEEGPIDYQEEHFVETNEFGLFSLQIGMGKPILGNLANLDWGVHHYYIRIGLDMNGMRDFIDLGATKLLSVPYAFHAMTVASGGENTDNQNLSLQGNILSIERGNEVDLTSLLGNGGSGGASFWKETDLGIHYNGTNASIGPDEEAPLLHMETAAAGVITLRDKQSNRGIVVDGLFGLFSIQNNSLGYWLRQDEDNGTLSIYGEEAKLNILLSSASDPNTGWLGIYGRNSNSNVRFTSLSGNPNHGFISVQDQNGETQAGLYVDSNGKGSIFADVKNFRIEHPVMADRDIVYASLEGPEAGAYVRGTTELKNGKARIDFPDHFKHVISDTHGMTVMITPLSVNSKGIAVIQKDKDGFTVQELFEGKGNYAFDWEVKGIRQGFENYEVIRDRVLGAATRQEKQILDVRNYPND